MGSDCQPLDRSLSWCGDQAPPSTFDSGAALRTICHQWGQCQTRHQSHGFWGNSRQQRFFDVRIFNPFAPSNSHDSLLSTYKKHERRKRREYEHRIREIEHGTFTPIVLATTGGWGPSASMMYKRLASLIADNTGSPYNQVMRMIRRRISFALIDASIMCLRGARSSLHHPKRTSCQTALLIFFDNMCELSSFLIILLPMLIIALFISFCM